MELVRSIENLTLNNKIGIQKMMLNFGIERTLANHVSVAYLAYMGKPPLLFSPTMDFRPREAPFLGDNFFRFGPIAFKFSHTSFQPKRRFLSIWSVNKKSIIRVLVIAS